MEPLEFAEKTCTSLNEHAKFADAKAGALLALIASVGAGMGVAAEPVMEAARVAGGPGQSVVVVAGSTALFGAAATTWFCLRAVSPRTPLANSLNSFPDIAAETTEEHVNRVGSMTGSELLASYCRHNRVLAQIAKEKFTAIQTAVRWSFVTLLAVYVFMVAYGIALATGNTTSSSGI